MTKAQAKKTCLEVWRYLGDNPEIKDKEGLPEKVYRKIAFVKFLCPLCDFLDVDYAVCPLYTCEDGGVYDKWCHAKQNRTRAKYAGLIVDAVEKW